MKQNQLIWFDEQTTTDVDGSSICSSPPLDVIMSKTPILKDLVEVLTDISDVWEHIGIALGVEKYKINSIKSDNNDDIVKLSDVLQQWLDSDEDVTWGTVVETVKGQTVNKKLQVDKIKEFLLRPDICKKYM
jgi:hypothetical protein